MIGLLLGLVVAQPGSASMATGGANAANLAAQLANPDELLHPAALPPMIGAAPIAAIDRVSRGSTPALPQGDISTGATPK